MENEEIVEPKEPEETELKEPVEPKEPEEPQEDYRAKLNAQNRFLEKEGYEFKDGKWQRKPKPEQTPQAPAPEAEPALSPKDMYALSQAQVHIDDFDYVTQQAKLVGGIPKALQDPDVQAVLEKRAERRKTANATNTRTQRPSQKQATDSDLLEGLKKGEVPEKGSPEAERLFWAKRGGKKS